MRKTYLLGSIVLGIVLLLAVLITLTATGVIGGAPVKLVFESASIEDVYDGEALMIQKCELINGELKEGHTYEALVYGKQTDVGTSDNLMQVKIFDENKADVTDTYEIEYKTGKIKVNPRPLKIAAQSASKQYDGTELKCEKYVRYGNTVLDHREDVIFGASRTDVGETANEITTRILTATGQDVTHNYAIENVRGALTVTPIMITIETFSDEKMYDGIPLVKDGYEHVSGEFMPNHVPTVIVTGTRTDAGEGDNTFILKVKDTKTNKDVSANYKADPIYGKLKIVPRPISVTTGDASRTYDGTPLVNTENGYTGELVSGHTIKIENTGCQTFVGSSDNTCVVEIKDANGIPVTKNYEIVGSFGTLEILPINITVASQGATKTYDTLPLENKEDCGLTEGTLMPGHELRTTVVGIQETVGYSKNEFGCVVWDTVANIDVTEQYKITKIMGVLKIEPIQITAASLGDWKYYDGEPLVRNNPETDVSIIAGELFAGHTIEFTITGIQYVAGSSLNTFAFEIKDAKGNSVTENYNVSTDYGDLEILPIDISVSTDSKKDVFTGNPLEADPAGWKHLSGELLDGHYFTSNTKAVGRLIDVGTIENEIDIEIFDGEGNDVTRNYNVEKFLGTIELLPMELTIVTESKTEVYTGEKLVSDWETGWELLGGQLLDGHEIKGSMTGKITDVGTAENTIFYYIVDTNNNNANVTYKYNIKENLGKLTVTPRYVTFTSMSDKKEYDGTELTNNVVLLTSGELAERELERTNVTGKQLLVGKSENEFTLEIWRNNTVNVSKNYNVTLKKGTLEVTPIKLSVQLGSASKTYDGTELTNNDYELKTGYLLDGHQIVITPMSTITDVGSCENNAVVTVVDTFRGNENVTDCYSIAAYKGKLEIFKRRIEVTTQTDSKTYDGQEFKKQIVNTIGEGPVSGQEVVADFGEGPFPINAGIYQNVALIKIMEGNVDKSGNYDIKVTYGTLTINKRDVTVSTNSASHVYDGNLFTSNGCTHIGGLVGTHEAVGEFGQGYINVGTYNNVATVKIMNGEDDVTSNYNVTVKYGTLTITKRKVTFTTSSASKVYDGMELTAKDKKVTAGSLVNGHEGELTYVVSPISVGTYANEASAIIKSGTEDVSANYEISVVAGTLKITPCPITIATKDYSKTYDGEALVYAECEVTAGKLAYGHKVIPIFSAYAVNAGEYENVASFTVVSGEEGSYVDESGNYTITSVFGKLTVNKRIVSIRTESDEKVYDGTPLKNPNWKVVSNTTVIDGHKLLVTVTGERLSVGESPNTIAEIYVYSVDASGNPIEDMSFNYDFTYIQEGTLVVKSPDSGNSGGDDDDGNDNGGDDNGDGENGNEIGPGNNGDLGYTGGSEEFEEAKKKTVAIITSTTKGTLHLKEKSFGNYNGGGFDTAPVYSTLIDGKYSMSYITGLALENAGISSDELKVEVMDKKYFFLPYYLDIDTPIVQKSDTVCTGTQSLKYTSYFYNYNFTGIVPSISVSDEYAKLEEDYSKYVYENYLGLPDSTRAEINKIIVQQGFDKDDPGVILQVATYIRTSNKYNLDYDKNLDKEDDIVVAFLSDKYSEGICQHYAASATVLFRALGIPARYTVGMVPTVNTPNEPTEVKAATAHAWVEVYIDGMGWMGLEVTGSGNGGIFDDGSDDNDNDNDNEEDPELPTLSVYPETVDALYYDGIVLNARNEIVGDETFNEYMDKLGYSYDVIVTGSISEVGYGQSTIARIVIYDETGAVVYDDADPTIEKKVNVRKGTGRLHIYERVINVTGASLTTTYDGNAHSTVDNTGYTVSGLKAGHTVYVDYTVSRVDAGASSNKFIVTILDSTGNDVTEEYKIEYKYGSITVNKREIVIKAGSAFITEQELIDVYEGEFSIDEDDYEIVGGTLVEGHTLTAKAKGSIDSIGDNETTVKSIVVKGSNGLSVTQNYHFTIEKGLVGVNP